ncbi:hypothetical protein VMF7928_04478 [Vibrio marisflavi CECT 7928]|uniref:Uncharacterized protein n=1 Tax=Vibrio marisflavi CECT 7928 TaxID=634439 RepID=A0ABN8E997_9VIBR|nr:hypothetical protein VMF7928_04478 [Vibrio marisflavi CECT 7928]
MKFINLVCVLFFFIITLTIGLSYFFKSLSENLLVKGVMLILGW